MNTKRPRLCSLVTENVEQESDTLQPNEVGITTFVQPLVKGFEAVLKNRWEDFIVREFRGHVYAKLTSLAPIPDPAPEVADFNTEEKLGAYMSELRSLNRGDSEMLKFKAPDNKSDRTQIHQAIRSLFSSLESTTLKEDSENFIIVRRKNNIEAKGSRQPRRRANGMAKNTPYCHFVLYKEGKDTLSAIQVLSRFLHVGPNVFSYAGTKDRRAITTQFVTAKSINSKTLSLLNARLHGLRVGNFSYVSSPLFLGDLDGNQFVVVLRSVCAPRSVVETAINAWKCTGFVNYYGLQRFGHSSKSKSFEIGKYLICSKWADAVNLILKPTFADLPFLRKIKERYLQSGDAKGCADECPVGIEKTLLLGISKYGKTLNAIQMLPRNLRQLYVHSYQSFLWNHVASRRMAQQNPGSFYAQPGDLYYNDKDITVSDNCADDVSFDDSALQINNSSVNSAASSKSLFTHPLVVGEDEINKIPLKSVVLPVPGYAVHYPKNQSADWYIELLKVDGLTLKDFNHSVK
ncbi:Pseudouridylate synthase 7 isoform 3 [Schistosoma japonicum]|nr:Pseudouridylate synthase 7 like [Schistosoma japonicum]KAH8860273.1 Pseudouridylate synthase 7 like [Schistosoma japonicum]TNN10351.1 Pseudouridylate synthase 7 isoform 3 [Schistosoma japonicum]TNN10355.1 Pseudouridylate synthase 7 isoform 3 [Schistosoma japonicum]